MNPLMRVGLILAVTFAACFAAYKWTPHHEGRSAFETLYFHVVPAPLVDDPHAPHEEQHLLWSFTIGGGMGEKLAKFDADTHTAGTQIPLYNLQIFQIAAVILCLVCFAGLANQIRSGRMDAFGRFFTGWAMWVRDEMVYPIMGKEVGARFLPYFLTLFFFLVFMNLLGLVPGSATATASIAVTAGMALTTLFCMLFFGMKYNGVWGFWKGLMPHVPWPLLIIIVPVELLGLLVKPFALTIRLFANLTGGHMVVLSFMGLIFFFGKGGEAAGMGYAVSPLAVGFGVFIMIIESFVALVQAYIFTQLSILFIGSSIHQEH